MHGFPWSTLRRQLRAAYTNQYRLLLPPEARPIISPTAAADFEYLRLLPPMRGPLYHSYEHYLASTTEAERVARWRLCARHAERRSGHCLPWRNVQRVFEAARGRCCYCGSLAVERVPQGVPWTTIGRRLGSLEHRDKKLGHTFTNLAWACMWCNTYPAERIPNAKCHGAIA
jgi:hypothetical protein